MSETETDKEDTLRVSFSRRDLLTHPKIEVGPWFPPVLSPEYPGQSRHQSDHLRMLETHKETDRPRFSELRQLTRSREGSSVASYSQCFGRSLVVFFCKKLE